MRFGDEQRMGNMRGTRLMVHSHMYGRVQFGKLLLVRANHHSSMRDGRQDFHFYNSSDLPLSQSCSEQTLEGRTGKLNFGVKEMGSGSVSKRKRDA